MADFGTSEGNVVEKIQKLKEKMDRAREIGEQLKTDMTNANDENSLKWLRDMGEVAAQQGVAHLNNTAEALGQMKDTLNIALEGSQEANQG